MLHPKVFQEFQPIGGVAARPSSGRAPDAVGASAKQVVTAAPRDTISLARRDRVDVIVAPHSQRPGTGCGPDRPGVSPK
ncbi:hypothetical protein GCM10010470_36550 [Saccharopolyspora taberi]|uniref:Uncharacterized protein n=1 Tax=Saccharopolyspora taberi TaxID=60895 RepID=A0ABN3VET6_9PSEU